MGGSTNYRVTPGLNLVELVSDNNLVADIFHGTLNKLLYELSKFDKLIHIPDLERFGEVKLFHLIF